MNPVHPSIGSLEPRLYKEGMMSSLHVQVEKKIYYL